MHVYLSPRGNASDITYELSTQQKQNRANLKAFNKIKPAKQNVFAFGNGPISTVVIRYPSIVTRGHSLSIRHHYGPHFVFQK